MKPILVLGIGSRLMMDDGIGVYVVEALAKQSAADEWLAYEVGETDFEFSLDLMLPAEYIIVIDAAMTGKSPGDISTFRLSEFTLVNPGISQHSLHFLDLVNQIAERKEGVIIGIEPFRIDFQWGLSKELSEAFELIICEVKEIISKLKKEYIESQKPAQLKVE